VQQVTPGLLGWLKRKLQKSGGAFSLPAVFAS